VLSKRPLTGSNPAPERSGRRLAWVKYRSSQLHVAVGCDLIVRWQDALLGNQSVGLQGIGHGQRGAGEGHLPRLPAAETTDADGDQQYSRAGQVTTELAFEALTNHRRIEVRVGRLLQRAAQRCAQLLGVFCQARTCSAVGALPEISLHQASVVIAELVVDVSVQIALAGGMLII
jgi:hypothetical protein